MQGAANPQNHNGASVSSMVSSLLQWVARPHCPNGSSGGCPQWLRPPNDRNGCPSDGSPQNPLKTRHWTTRARSWLFLLNIDIWRPYSSPWPIRNLPRTFSETFLPAEPCFEPSLPQPPGPLLEFCLEADLEPSLASSRNPIAVPQKVQL